MRLHRGEPENPTKLRGYTGTLMNKASKTEGRNNYTDHRIARWYGVSFKLKWFVGLWLLGETTYPTEQGPLPY
jgi:hypothetical protein